MRDINGKIRLQLSDKITFPDKCIYCGCENPDGTVPLSPREEEAVTGERMILFAVPACTACAYSQAARERQIGIVACALFLVIMTIAGSLILKSYYSLIYVALGILLVALMFSLDAFKISKPLISIEAVDNSLIIFHSPNRKYLALFRELNQTLESEKTEHGA